MFRSVVPFSHESYRRHYSKISPFTLFRRAEFFLLAFFFPRDDDFPAFLFRGDDLLTPPRLTSSRACWIKADPSSGTFFFRLSRISPPFITSLITFEPKVTEDFTARLAMFLAKFCTLGDFIMGVRCFLIPFRIDPTPLPL